MLTINFIPLDYDHFDWQGRNYVKIIGRDDKGKRICLVDSFEPYFWVILKEGIGEKKIKELKERIENIQIQQPLRITKIEKVEVHNKKFLGKDVKALKVFITNYKDAHLIADKIDFPEIEARREYDLTLITKYIIDKKLAPLTWHKVSGELLTAEDFGGLVNDLDVDFCIKAEKIEKIEEKPFFPKILAYDIEADEFEIGKGEILMISLVSKNFKKVLTWKKVPKVLEFVEFCKDETEMLEKFVEYVKEQQPDMLVGYFSDGFDLPYLKARAEKLKVKLALGLDNSQPVFARGRITSARVFGIVHIDLFRFIETVYAPYLQSETLGLNEVANEILGEGKKDFDAKKASQLKEHEWLEYFEYNLQDSLLTYKLAEKFWPDMQEFCKIIQEPLFEITRDSMSQLVEGYIIHHLDEYNEIAEKRPLHDEIEQRRARGKYEGAFVLQPKPGLYEKVVMFDFTSMYSSVIVTYNLSKSTLISNKKEEKEAYEVNLGEEGKVYFSKKPGFFPTMLNEMVEKRKKYKEEYKKDPSSVKRARSNAYKLLANACYGYQGFFGARYYCREAAAATAALARKAIIETIGKIKANGYQVVYSDTDSIAFLQGDRNKSEILDFLKKLNSELPGIMELELEDFYARGLWVTKRTGEFGAKKKYALITEDGKLKIRGFETVRRDWCNLARELQNEVLLRILKDGNEKNALEYTKKVIKELKERQIEKEKIIIRTQLKKPISEYKAITPHVIAAKKMEEQGVPISAGMLVEYFIAETRETKKLVREKVKLPDEEGEYDIKYYLEHQIIPAVENIFEIFNIKKEELLSKEQKKLLEF
ncbi:MAG: DNA-directed DNA polymerase [Candidatus Pacearchaeota archaeon]|nr:DNA-directed DNA polymerase [Candidatus Pacearchaeota archaeon]